MVKKNKRGQLGNLGGIVLTLVIVGILIGVAFLVLGELRDNLSTTTNTVVNESVTPTDAGVYLAYNSSTAGVNCYNNAQLVAVCNQSGACGPTTLISLANYSLNSYSGLLKNVTANANDDYNRALNFTYTYSSGDDACEGVDATMTTTQTIPTFLPIIVILLVVGILLAIVFGVLIPKGKSETAYV